MFYRVGKRGKQRRSRVLGCSAALPPTNKSLCRYNFDSMASRSRCFHVDRLGGERKAEGNDGYDEADEPHSSKPGVAGMLVG